MPHTDPWVVEGWDDIDPKTFDELVKWLMKHKGMSKSEAEAAVNAALSGDNPVLKEPEPYELTLRGKILLGHIKQAKAAINAANAPPPTPTP